MMNVTINSNAFTKMDRMIGLSVVEIKILDYYLQNRILSGNVKIYGEYYTEDSEFETNNGLKEFENIIPFACIVSLLIGCCSFYDFIYTTNGSPELSFKITQLENI